MFSKKLLPKQLSPIIAAKQVTADVAPLRFVLLAEKLHGHLNLAKEE